MKTTNSIFLKKNSSFQRVNIEDITLLEADNNYTTIHTNDEKYVYAVVLKKIEAKMPKSHFMRVHRSYMINLQAVEGFEGNTLFIQNKRIPVSRQYREEIFGLLDIL